jgi:hypothetical protein
MRLRFLQLAVSILVFSSFASADEWNKSFALTGKPELRVNTGDANIRVEPWDKKTVEVHVTTVNWKIGEDGFQIIDHQSGNVVELEVPTHNNRVYFGWNNTTRRRIDIEVHMPKEARLNLRTHDGNIVVRAMKGDFTFRTGDGRQQFEELDGAVDASSGDGSINVTGRFDRFNVRSGDGRLEARVLPGSKITSEWSMRAGDGSINLLLPGDFVADVDAATGDGHLDFDMPLQMTGRIGSRSIHGKINGGGPMLSLHTGDGSIRVSKLLATY